MIYQLNDQDVVQVSHSAAPSDIVLVCEHASSHIPEELHRLGLEVDALQSHIAWDPGALGVANALADELGAILVASKVSRLVYDCNRPTTAPDAMPSQSEIYAIPGNDQLSDSEKTYRIARYYAPFHQALTRVISMRSNPVVVTIHSFTPVFSGTQRNVEIGILHDSDSRLADAMLTIKSRYNVLRNVPYGPEDGVTHTLKEHAIKGGHLNVMIEMRNDLIADQPAQTDMAKTLADWITEALIKVGSSACKV